MATHKAIINGKEIVFNTMTDAIRHCLINRKVIVTKTDENGKEIQAIDAKKAEIAAKEYNLDTYRLYSTFNHDLKDAKKGKNTEIDRKTGIRVSILEARKLKATKTETAKTEISPAVKESSGKKTEKKSDKKENVSKVLSNVSKKKAKTEKKSYCLDDLMLKDPAELTNEEILFIQQSDKE